MGYSASKTKLMIGLGVSSISDSWYSFAQNEKNLEDYYQLLEWDKLPIYRGHLLTSEDLIIRHHILNLMCQFKLRGRTEDYFKIPEILIQLQEMENDGLVRLAKTVLKLQKPVSLMCVTFVWLLIYC
jgi:oxygen-independent coproporphyrinogen-3 oxidase